jgi:glycosyltransferase involved in cell wall biosynthesis
MTNAIPSLFFLCSVKVLLLHQHFNTPAKGGAIRSYYLAKALVDRGIQTVVITGHNEKSYIVDNVEGIEVHYLPIPYDNRFGFYKRGYSFLQYITKSTTLAGRFKDANLCYAISVPITIGLAALWIKKRFGIPYIFEVGDLWPDAPIQLGFIKSFFLKQFLFGLERTIYQGAESIVALSIPIKSAIENKVKNKTVHVLPNMADVDFYLPENKKDVLKKKFNVEGKFVVSYIGAVGFANGLGYFLECARAAQKAQLPVQFFLCGDGAMLDRLKEVVINLKIDNLAFLPFQNREGVREIMNVTNASFICYRPVPILETGSPNKYFDGLAGGKLILINFKGWMKEEIEHQQCGVYLDANHPSSFVTHVSGFVNNADLLDQYRENARRLAEEKYSRKKLSAAFVEIITHR